MKFLKNLTAAALITCLAATTSFAAVEPSARPDGDEATQQTTDKGTEEKKDFRRIFPGHKQHEIKQQDPIKMLEGMKEKLQEKVRNGEITKEKAEAISKKIDAKIREIKEFNKLSLQEKKERLTNKFKASIEEKVKKGKLKPEEAEQLIRKFSERIKNWDGTGYPMFGRKKSKMHKGNCEGSKE